MMGAMEAPIMPNRITIITGARVCGSSGGSRIQGAKPQAMEAATSSGTTWLTARGGKWSGYCLLRPLSPYGVTSARL